MKLEALRLVAESRFLSTPQVAGLLGVSLKSARDHLRDLLDMQLVRPVGVPGVALGMRALVGPTIYVARKEGLRVLEEVGLLPPEAKRPPSYGPEQYQFLAHELSVRDVLVWLSLSARKLGHSVSRWDCSGGLQVGSTKADALFTYDIGGKGVVGIVEADLGSERGTSTSRADRWATKVAAYSELFKEENWEKLQALTGAPVARLVVTVPDGERAEWILRRLSGTPVAADTWIAVRGDLEGSDVYSSVWRKADGSCSSFVPR